MIHFEAVWLWAMKKMKKTWPLLKVTMQCCTDDDDDVKQQWKKERRM